MSKSSSHENSQPNFYLLNWFVRIILYGIVFASVFVPSYVTIEHDTCGRDEHRLEGILILEGIVNHRCRMVEARNKIGALNRAQQAYHLEQNKFADSIADVGLGLAIETYSHRYRIVQPMIPVQDLDRLINHLPMRMAIAQKKIELQAENRHYVYPPNYLGFVYKFTDISASGETEITTGAILCEMKEENPLPTAMPKVNNGIMECPVGSKQLGS